MQRLMCLSIADRVAFLHIPLELGTTNETNDVHWSIQIDLIEKNVLNNHKLI